MTLDALQQPCPHFATPAERSRDPRYFACNAAAGEPCRWARRYDGVPDPAFHSERLELTVRPPEDPGGTRAQPDPEQLRRMILQTGLV